MKENMQEQVTPEWEDIFSHCNENKPEGDDIKKRVKEEFKKDFQRITSHFTTILYKDDNKAVTDFINDIPDKFTKLKIRVRKYEKHYFSCIITDEEVDLLASMEHQKWVNEMEARGWGNEESLDEVDKVHPDLKHFSEIDTVRQKFYRELIYTIPVIFVRCGYELFKPAEEEFRNDEQLEYLARAIHARYCMLMKTMDEESIKNSVYEQLSIVNDQNRENFSKEYDDLSADIKSSNLDSAHHITTKLLSIGYTIEEGNSETEQILLHVSTSDIETMAKMEHERWAWEKRLSGWTYAPERNNKNKEHNCLVPYKELPELEKEKDRDQVKRVPILIKAINYKVVPLSPEQSKNISYIPQQRRLLDETKLKMEIVNEKLAGDVEKIKGYGDSQNIKDQLSDTIKGLSFAIDSLNMAAGIQQNILPSKIYFKTCLPESFIFFKPKDILSGDFYFISKRNDSVVCAAADCTGHGTSAALLSMICSNFIDQAVNDKNITDPSAIISFVYKKLVSFMKRHYNTIISDHGMEIAICTIIPASRTLLYAGIKRPLYIFRDDKLEIIKSQKVSSRGYESVIESTEPSQQIQLQKGNTLYMFSDGYPDQFGGPQHKNFSTRQFKKMLETIQPLSMLEQYTTLNNTIEQWKNYDPKNSVEQTDDILVVGIRV
ncbi:MAG: SpoIIE family protein phosphatase [Spirochaetales bacterium]|nr:SpoIIE family protein phosphatase [Spirochaetales bacterium]